MYSLYLWLRIPVSILSSAIFLFAYSLALHAQEDPVLLSAGDIATCGSTRDSATADLLDTLSGTIATLGDTVYPDGTHEQFSECYAPTWGRHKERTRPVPGNHDYHTEGAAGYYSYFGPGASPLDNNCIEDCRGYYSYDLGAWHIVALNSEIDISEDSEQVQWLRADLAAHPNVCTLAYWHHPRFSSGQHGNATETQALWDVLYEHGAEVVLNGHEHNYERFAPQTPTGQADSARGIRQFVVGTGGIGLRSMASTKPNSEARNNSVWGVLKLTLHASSYDWEFVPIAGQTFTDKGSGNCFTADTPEPEPTPTEPPLDTGEHTFVVEGDTYAQSDESNRNFGRVSVLRVDASPARVSFLHFDVQGLQGTVVNAELHIYARSTSRRGYEVRSVGSQSWSEGTLTYNNMPDMGDIVSTSGGFSRDEWTVATVTSLVNGDGTVSFALTGVSSTSITLSSQESDNPPKLVVTTSTNGEVAIAPVDDAGNDPENPSADNDGDGLSDEDELAYGTDLSGHDSDGDELPDLWEVEGVVEPTSSHGDDGPQGDPDGDGISNLDEFSGQTEPLIAEGTTVEIVPGALYLPLISGE